MFKRALDWKEFVRAVVADVDGGLSSVEISEKYANQLIRGEGVVLRTEIDCSGESRPFVQLSMPPVTSTLSDGRIGTTDFLCLDISIDAASLWKKVTKGATIQFETCIKEKFGPFLGLQWCDLEDGGGYLKIATHGSKLIN